jgi:hypothetical protein
MTIQFKAIPAIEKIRTVAPINFGIFRKLLREAAPSFVGAGCGPDDAFDLVEQALDERDQPIELGEHRDKAYAFLCDKMEEEQNPNLRRALALAEAGLEVFPCREREQVDPKTGEVFKVKSPYTSHGFKDASRDPDQLREWWRKWPDALVGLPTGEKNSVAVLDLDRKDGKDGVKTLEAIGLEVPSTLTLPTPTGGEHRYFRHLGTRIASNSDILKTLAGQRKTGIDIRGDGGYVIVWGDIDPATLSSAPDWPQEIEAARQRDETERQARQEYPRQEQQCDCPSFRLNPISRNTSSLIRFCRTSACWRAFS